LNEFIFQKMRKELLLIIFFTIVSLRILGQEFIDKNMECLKLTSISKDPPKGFK